MSSEERAREDQHQHQQGVAGWLVWLTSAIAAAGFALAVVAFPILSLKMSDERGGSDVLFLVAYLALLSGWVQAWRGRQQLAANVAWLFGNSPIGLLVLAINIVLVSLLVINVMTKVGFLLLILCFGVVLMISSLPWSGVCFDRMQRFLKLSPISFGALFLMLIALEVFLRFCPQYVGGGGGGNPALRQIYRGLYTVNSDGLRGPEIDRSMLNHRFRIVATGDSFTFGQGVGDQETYPYFLQQNLDLRLGRDRFLVLNAGQSGTNLTDHCEQIADLPEDFQPDLLVVQFYLNDLEPRYDADVPHVDGVVDRWTLSLAYHSYAVFFLKDRFEGLRRTIASRGSPGDARQQWAERMYDQIRHDDVGWREAQDGLVWLSEYSNQRGIPVVLMLYPHPGETLSGLTLVHQHVTQVAEQAGLAVLDLDGQFGELSAKAQLASQMDHHPSAAMHQIAALKLTDYLVERGLTGAKGADPTGKAPGDQYRDDAGQGPAEPAPKKNERQ